VWGDSTHPCWKMDNSLLGDEFEHTSVRLVDVGVPRIPEVERPRALNVKGGCDNQ
jgi:hypothetical protein